MKPNLGFPKKAHTSLFLAIVALLLLLTQSAIFAGSASWNDTGSDWNTNSDWTPNTGFPNGPADTATFNLANTFTAVGISANTEVASITFSNLATNPYTITVNPVIFLTISGTGITNNSGTTQNFVTAVNGSGNEGVIDFTNSATAGSNTTFTNNAGTVSGAGGGFTQFNNTSTAGNATITNNGATVSGARGGETNFLNTSTAGSATITNNGGTVAGAFGGVTTFFDTSKAGSATLIANGVTVAGAGGGTIRFSFSSTGDTASVDVENKGAGTAGNLDISFESKTVSNPTGNVTIGSLEGSGNVFLGGNNLTVGSNNLSKTFSGVIQDGGIFGGTGGSLTKTGTGTFTLTGANIYTGGTTVNAGSLFVNTPKNFTDSGTGTGSVTVNSGATLGGSGSIGGGVIGNGAVTVNSGATLAPGPTGDGSTGILRTGALTLVSGSTFSVDLEGPIAGTNYDQVFAFGRFPLWMPIWLSISCRGFLLARICSSWRAPVLSAECLPGYLKDRCSPKTALLSRLTMPPAV